MTHPLANPELEVTVDELARWRQREPDLQVVDVREAYEHEAGRVPGVRHIELERLASQAETIDRDRPVVFQCRLGARSLLAAQAFRAAGFDAWSMAGGLTAWDAAGLPLEPDGAYVAEH